MYIPTNNNNKQNLKIERISRYKHFTFLLLKIIINMLDQSTRTNEDIEHHLILYVPHGPAKVLSYKDCNKIKIQESSAPNYKIIIGN